MRILFTNLVAADVRRLILFRADETRASSRRLLRLLSCYEFSN